MLSIYSSTKQNSYWLNSRAQCSAQGWYSDKRGGKCWWFVKAVRLSASSAKIGCNNEKNGGVITKSRSQLRGGPSLLSQNSHLSQAMPDQLFYNRLFTARCKHAFKNDGLMIICQKRFCRHEVLHHDCAATILKALNLWDGNSALHFPIWVWCCSKCNLEKGWHRNIIWHFSQHFSICTDRNERNVLMLEPWLPWFKPSSSTTWFCGRLATSINSSTQSWEDVCWKPAIDQVVEITVLPRGGSINWFSCGCNSSPITYLPQKKLNWQQDL